MKRALCVLVVSFAFFAHLSAQSLSLKVGTVVLNHGGAMNNQRIEALFAYPLSDKFDLTLATGYDRSHRDAYRVIVPDVFIADPGNRAVDMWGAASYPELTHHYIPIVAGGKYSLMKNTLAPYLTAEFGYYFDLASEGDIKAHYRAPAHAAGDFNPGMIFKLGGGVQYRYSEKLTFDVSTRMIHESTDAETVEVMAGIVLPL